MRRYGVILGEALIDLLETTIDDEIVYRPAIGGGPLNVAVGTVRLGCDAELVGSLGDDVFGQRIRVFLREAGVGDRGLVTVPVPTTLAVTAFDGNKPDFHFYGQPPSYGLFGPDDLDEALVAGAAALYCGSIALLCEPALAAARRAWTLPGPVRFFDPNVRQHLLDDGSRVRSIVEEFAATADVVKLSADDAQALYRTEPLETARHLADLGAGTVVLTLGPDGALVVRGGRVAEVPGVSARAVDTTGAGDACMAALVAGSLRDGMPDDLAGWTDLVGWAMRVAAVVCELPGGAVAMPTADAVTRRFADR
ncbi:MAG: carbohydrate kinase [Dactylosporangium sp.]|nr:carbohydrate kinase [Dactylosporangium sp.]NNJ62477.1 carbohydrate kinase [Dactylosporangium sp.]